MPNLSPFSRRKNKNRGLRLLSSGNLHVPPQHTDHDEDSVPVNGRIILSKWKDLKNLGSINRRQLAPLVESKENREIALNFKGKDAAVVINTIDKALKQIECSEETRLYALKILRKLAGGTRQVPKSYLIGRWTKYIVEDEIVANGSFADIREGRLGERAVAVRTIRTSQETQVDDVHKAFCKESVLWMNISHPNILKLIAVDIRPRAKKFSMISEMMINGNIMNYIRTRKANRLSLLRDVASGLEHLHKLGIIHGDLKGHNVLVNNETPPRACISDFGLCVIAPWMSFDPTTQKGAGGTFGYMAPELYSRNAKHTKEADVYAFGMVVYEVATGSRPSRKRRLMELPMLTTTGSRPARPEDPVASSFGEGTWELLEKCWDGNPRQRPTIREVLEHFERISATSTLVDPGPIPCVQDTDVEASSRLDDSSRRFSILFAQQPQSGSRRLQQSAFAAHAFVNPRAVLSPAPILAVKNKSSLLGRVRRRVIGLKLPPPQDKVIPEARQPETRSPSC